MLLISLKDILFINIFQKYITVDIIPWNDGQVWVSKVGNPPTPTHMEMIYLWYFIELSFSSVSSFYVLVKHQLFGGGGH